MNALDRLSRSLDKLPQRAGDAIHLNGKPLRGLFAEQPGDSLALGFVQGEPRRSARLQLRLADLPAAGLQAGDTVAAAGRQWEVIPPVSLDGDGFVNCMLEEQT